MENVSLQQEIYKIPAQNFPKFVQFQVSEKRPGEGEEWKPKGLGGSLIDPSLHQKGHCVSIAKKVTYA